MISILVFFHCEANTGYAIGSLEQTFFKMAERITNGDWSKIHFAYSAVTSATSTTLPNGFRNVIQFDPASSNEDDGLRIAEYIRHNGITIAFGFDQPPNRPMYRHLRYGGIRLFLSYWGAPMSKMNNKMILWLKKLQVMSYRHGPDHYIFESNGMAMTAILGRGIPPSKVSVAYLGTNTHEYKPDPEDHDYPYTIFGIPHEQKIFFYSGHMEERKGVHVLIRAAKMLYDEFSRTDFHLLILGNRNNEERSFDGLMIGKHSEHVTFGGYRDDLRRIHHGCYAGIIGSTGWDSLTCSAIEMASSGLPLLVSDIPGLNETIIDGQTGRLFPRGDHRTLAALMSELLDNPALATTMGKAARSRAIAAFSKETQVERLTEILSIAINKHGM